MSHLRKILQLNKSLIFKRTIHRSSVTLQTARENIENEKSTHFGFETVKESEKAKKG